MGHTPRFGSPTSTESRRHSAREQLEDEFLAFASSLDSVGQPLQLLAQRGLGARLQVGSRQVATARLEPLRVEFVRQPEVHKLVDERRHGGTGGEAGGMTRLSSQSSTCLVLRRRPTKRP
jgi:hypothetical protein